QLPDLGLAAFDHLFPLRIRWSERITPCSSKTIPFSRIRNQHKNLDSISYGSGISCARALHRMAARRTEGPRRHPLRLQVKGRALREVCQRSVAWRGHD